MTQQVTNDMLAFDGGSLGFRNRIINGAMSISQRGASFATPAAGAYTLDRWMINWSGAAPASVAQVAGPAGFAKALQITGAVGNTVTNTLHRIESYNCSDLSGATVTIQVNVSVSTAQTVAWQLGYATAQDNFTGVTAISSGTWSATSTATTFTATVSGLPAGAVNGLQLVLWPNNGGAFTSGTFTVTGVQLEKGSTDTPFEYRPYGAELALCQRYYQIVSAGWSGNTNNTSPYYAVANYQVTMRSSPTCLLGSNISTQISFSAASTGDLISAGSARAIYGRAAIATANGSKFDGDYAMSSEL